MMLRPIPGGCVLSIHIQPGAKSDAIKGTHGNALKISVTAPPSDGRANAAVIAFLAKRLDIPRLSIDLISGRTSRTKMLRITGITVAQAEGRLFNDLA